MKEQIIPIIRYVINPKGTLPKIVEFKEVLPLFKFHSLENILYYASELGLINLSNEEKLKLTKIHQTAIYKTAFQEAELLQISEAFTNAKIPFLPLKGSIIKHLYPKIDMRSMADLDILVEKKNLRKVTPLLINLGYELISKGGNHDVYHKQPFMNIEIHRHMIDESYQLANYYEDIWKKVIPKDIKTTQLVLSSEDFYLFLIAHSAKHYGTGGTGIRSVLDIYIFLKHFPALNNDYLKRELVKMGLVNFERHFRTLAHGWFEDIPLSEEELELEDYLIKSGVYGTTSHAVISRLSLEDETKSLRYRKWKFIWLRAFPSFRTMKRIFPSLRYLPFMVPLYYLIRIMKAIYKGSAKKQIFELKQVKEEDIKTQHSIKEKTGRLK
jgi:hypothetical protein